MVPYYEEQGIQIFHGDCREILPSLGPVDLVLTDPPYGVKLGARANNQRFNRKRYTQIDDKPETVIPFVREVLDQCFCLTSRLVMTPGVKNMFAYPQPEHVGCFYYPSASGCNSWGFSCWQPIFYYGKDPYGGKGSRPDSFQSTEAAPVSVHPCPKPLGQWKTLLSRVSLPGETVLDPMVGSGTTLVAAKALGLKAIGIDIERDYLDEAISLLRQEVLSFEVA